MKKILYSLLALGFLITSCADFGDISKDNFATGPAVTISVTETTDSTFTFTVTPASGTDYYTYAVIRANAASELNGYTLLKNGYAGLASGVLNTGKNATYTFNMRNSKGEPLGAPNTTYQIYAVASSDKGIVGNVANSSVTTTDQLIPGPKTVKAEGTAVGVTFSENVAVGEGKVLVKYYKEWSILNTIDADPEDIKVSINGAVVTIDTPKAPAGAFVTVSWEEGAFVDGFGNKCKAFNSGLNPSTGQFTGVNYRIPVVQFNAHDSLFVAPKLGSAFGDWEEFEAVMEFKFDIYRNESKVKAGDIKAVYKNDNRTISVNVPPSLWSVSGKELTLALPEAPQFGDSISIVFEKNVIFDVYGNGNTKYEQKVGWVRSYQYKRNMIIGSYKLDYEEYYDEEMVTESITIKEDPSSANGVLMSGFMGTATEVKATFNGDYATLTIKNDQEVGRNANYIFIISNADEDEDIVLNIASNGNLTSPVWIGYYVLNVNTLAGLGWSAIAIDPVFTKQPAPSPAMRTNAKGINSGGLKIHKAPDLRK